MPALRKIIKNPFIDNKVELKGGPLGNDADEFDDMRQRGPLDNSNPQVSVETYISSSNIARDGENVDEVGNPVNPTMAAATLSNYRDHNQGMTKKVFRGLRESAGYDPELALRWGGAHKAMGLVNNYMTNNGADIEDLLAGHHEIPDAKLRRSAKKAHYLLGKHEYAHIYGHPDMREFGEDFRRVYRDHITDIQRKGAAKSVGESVREEVKARLRPLLETIRQIGKMKVPEIVYQTRTGDANRRSMGQTGPRRDIGPSPPYGLRFQTGQEDPADQVNSDHKMVDFKKSEFFASNLRRSGYDVAPDAFPEPIGHMNQIIPGGILPAIQAYVGKRLSDPSKDSAGA